MNNPEYIRFNGTRESADDIKNWLHQEGVIRLKDFRFAEDVAMPYLRINSRDYYPDIVDVGDYVYIEDGVLQIKVGE